MVRYIIASFAWTCPTQAPERTTSSAFENYEVPVSGILNPKLDLPGKSTPRMHVQHTNSHNHTVTSTAVIGFGIFRQTCCSVATLQHFGASEDIDIQLTQAFNVQRYERQMASKSSNGQQRDNHTWYTGPTAGQHPPTVRY